MLRSTVHTHARRPRSHDSSAGDAVALSPSAAEGSAARLVRRRRPTEAARLPTRGGRVRRGRVRVARAAPGRRAVQDPNRKGNTMSTLYCTASFPVPVMWSGRSAVEHAGLFRS